jgi:hypothetical protein
MPRYGKNKTEIAPLARMQGGTPAEGLVEAGAFLFVVFDGGDKSIAEVV